MVCVRHIVTPMANAKIRLFVEHPLGAGQTLTLTPEQAHYLFGVMRQSDGAEIAVFNGRDGEWLARIEMQGKRKGVLHCVTQSGPQVMPPDIWLLFAPLKKARTDFVVEKATELGVARIQSVLTEYTNSERVRPDRLRAHAIEAAEQCGGTYVPEIEVPLRLGALLENWPQERQLIFCDEASAGQNPAHFPDHAGPTAILIGPEGGFSPAERARLLNMPLTHRMTLGPRILRAETAAVAALTLWQAARGDWPR